GSATFLRMLSANRVDAIIGFRELFSAYAYKDNIDITQFSHQSVGKVPVYLWVSRESHMSNYIDELMDIAWTHKLKGAPEPTPY
ncbi:MAG: hypothetical protein VXZ35_02745, partial [Pseudomonadota bacterium]|nr:hypothetical protein [Pseudomonadota bacterium]